MSARVPEFSEVFAGRSAVGGMGLFLGGERTEADRFSADPNLRSIPFGNAPRGTADTLEASAVVRKNASIPIVASVAAFAQILPSIVPTVLTMIDLDRIVIGHPLPNQAMCEPVLAHQSNLAVTEPVRGGVGSLAGESSIPGVPRAFCREVLARSDSPSRRSSDGVVVKTLAQKLLRWHCAYSHCRLLRGDMVRTASAVERRCGPHPTVFGGLCHCR